MVITGTGPAGIAAQARLLLLFEGERGAFMEQMKQAAPNPMGTEPVGRLLLRFALPSVVCMLVNALYNLVDQVFIGQSVGYLGNAAAAVTSPVVTVILSLANLIGAGVGAYTAIKLGEGKTENGRRALGNLFTLQGGAGLLVCVLGLLFLEPVLRAFGATPENLALTAQYAAIILLGAPFHMLSIGLSNLVRVDGSPRFAMGSMMAGALLNVALDPLFIFTFGWGVRGAAVATVLAQALSVAAMTWYFLRRGKTLRLCRENLRLSLPVCREAIPLGISSCITQVSAVVLQTVMNHSLVYYGERSGVGGDIALGAMGIVLKTSSLLLSVCIGVMIGAQPILGFNRGAGRPDRVRKTYLCAAGIATAFCAAGWLAVLLFPRAVLGLFGIDDPRFMAFGVRCMRVYLACFFGAGFQVVSTNYFQSTGQPLRASLLSMLRQVILLIPLLLVLPPFLGLDGVLLAGPLSDLGSDLVVGGFMVLELRRLGRDIRRWRETGSAARAADA